MISKLPMVAFTVAFTVLGLFFSFEIMPGVSSFVGASMLVIGGTTLICQLIMHWLPAR